MADHATFERVDEPRGDVTREWDVFVREATEEPLRHAGTVSAPAADVAREQATTLFGWQAEAIWLCPADETIRPVEAGQSLAGRAGGGHDGDAGPAEGDAR